MQTLLYFAVMEFQLSPRSRDALDRVTRFIDTHIAPAEDVIFREIHSRNHGGNWGKWTVHPLIDELKGKARAEGLWNFFLPDATLGAGLTTL